MLDSRVRGAYLSRSCTLSLRATVPNVMTTWTLPSPHTHHPAVLVPLHVLPMRTSNPRWHRRPVNYLSSVSIASQQVCCQWMMPSVSALETPSRNECSVFFLKFIFVGSMSVY